MNMRWAEDTTIPIMIFAPIGQRGRASLGATAHIVDLTTKYLQITRYQLALLLGLDPSSLYRWLRGGGSPSAHYCMRIVQLWAFQWQGLPVCNMRKIMWEDSLILWKDNSVTREDHLPGGSGTVPEKDCRNTWQMAEMLTLRNKEAKADNHRRGRLSPHGAHPPARRQVGVDIEGLEATSI